MTKALHNHRYVGHTFLAIECPTCCEYTEKLLTWLRCATSLPCHSCGASIDIASGRNRMLIDTVVSLKERLNGELRKGSR